MYLLKPATQQQQQPSLLRDNYFARELLACWPLQEGATLKTLELVNNNTGTKSAALIQTFGLPGAATKFNASSSVISTAANVDVATFSISGWIRPDATTLYQRIITTGSANSTRFILVIADANSNSQLIFSANNGTEKKVGSGALTLGRWYFFVATFDGTTASVYIDGVKKSGTTEAGWTYPTVSTLNIGARSASSYPLNGGLTNLCVYKKCWSDSEVTRLSANPWQIFSRKNIASYFGVVADGATTLAGDNASQSNSSTTASISQIHTLSGDDSSQSNASSTGAISQTHVLSGASSDQANNSSIGAVSADNTANLTGDSVSQANIGSTAAITQTHSLTSANCIQGNASGAGSISTEVSVALTGSNSNQANTSLSAAISQIHVLTGANSNQTNTSWVGNNTAPFYVMPALRFNAQLQLPLTVNNRLVLALNFYNQEAP